MKKQVCCLFTTFVLLLIFNLPKAAAADDFSGCCKPPIDIIYWCNDLPYDFNPRNLYQLQALFGKPQNKCYPNAWQELTPTLDLSSCETGTIIRRFKVPAHYGGYEYCDQRIVIKGSHNYDIRFPADIVLNYCGAKPPVEKLWTNESSCDLLAINVEDYNFLASPGGGCSKIFRTYKVINWCEYDGISDPVVIDRGEDCDGLPGDEPVWVLRRSDGYAFIDRDNEPWNDNPRAYERVTCSPKNPKGYWRKVRSTGYWQYTQHIKISDNVPPVIDLLRPAPICSYNTVCTASIDIPFTVSDICTPNDIRIKVFIDGKQTAAYTKGGNYAANGTYKVGDHFLEIHATDGCGNTTVQKTTFTIVDCKAPAPICINGISISLMPTPPNTDADGDGDTDKAAMTIWASDLLTTSQITDCSDVGGISIGRLGEIPSFDKTSLTLTCGDLGKIFVRIYVWDKAYNPYSIQPDGTRGGRNYSFCQTYIVIRANNNICVPPPPPAPIVGSIVGSVQTADEYGLEAVQIALTGKDSAMQLTKTAGNYVFDSLGLGKSYILTPSLSGNYLEGLDVSDLVIIEDHLTGTKPIYSPYKLIAADVNRSGDITTADVIELRQLIMGVSDRLPNSASWRFVDATFLFPNPINPWKTPFPESVSVDTVQVKNDTVNFIAIKIGDMDGSLQTARLAIGTRNAHTTNLLVESQSVTAGTTFRVPIQLENTEAQAAQFALYFNSNMLEMIGIDYEIAQAEHFNLHNAKTGDIRMVWEATADSYSTAANSLCTFQFRALQEARLSDVLRLNERVLPAQVHEQNGTIANLKLAFIAPKTPLFALFQNVPNPFRDETVIGFQLPEATQATLKIHDLTGKLLLQQTSYFDKGIQQVRIPSTALPAQGVLLYTLETPQHQATGKMIILPR